MDRERILEPHGGRAVTTLRYAGVRFMLLRGSRHGWPVALHDFGRAGLIGTSLPEEQLLRRVNSDPLVSVIMPCYEHGEFVEQSITSILSQTFPQLELVVINDGSRDSSPDIIQRVAAADRRIRFINHSNNTGLSRSRNEGIRVSRGEFIAFCDADDVWKPEKLRLQLDLLHAHSQYDITYSDAAIINERGQLTGQLFSDLYPAPQPGGTNLFRQLCETNFINLQTVLMRRVCLKENAAFDESIRWIQDWWLWLRLARKHKFLPDSRILAQYRVHPRSTSLTQRRGYARDRWKVGKRNLKAHSDLSIDLQALLWYQMSAALTSLGKRRLATRFLWHTLAVSLQAKASPKRLAACLKRLATLYSQRLFFRKKTCAA